MRRLHVLRALAWSSSVFIFCFDIVAIGAGQLTPPRCVLLTPGDGRSYQVRARDWEMQLIVVRAGVDKKILSFTPSYNERWGYGATVPADIANVNASAVRVVRRATSTGTTDAYLFVALKHWLI